MTLGFLLAATVCLLGCPVSTGSHPMHRINGEIKTNLRAIQIGCERYASDNDGVYPEDVSEVISEGYMDAWPTVRDPDGAEMTMEPIEFESAPNHGMFVYVPIRSDDAVMGYYLMAYGTVAGDGMDVDGDGTNDHIIEVLDGINTDTPDIPIADLLGE